ncbi:MAG: L,D-transpeptidase family protein [Amphritea sp.]
MKQKHFLSVILSLLVVILPFTASATVPVTTHQVPSDSQQESIQLEEIYSKGITFAAMMDAVRFYEEMDLSGQWEMIPEGPLLRLNDSHWQVPVLRRQLLLHGDLELVTADTEMPELFDVMLHQALSRFQERHGTKIDGILGPESRRLLNITPRHRADLLMLNLDRQEDFLTHSGQRYIQVNIPEYKLRLYDQGEVLLDMKTIIGRKTRQTPVFNTTVKTLVINPSWNVPKSIAFKDILPLWRKDKSYLSRRNLIVLSGWSDVRVVVPTDQVDPEEMYQGAKYYRLWEPPGIKNALGRIKFISRSQYAIYLHDTPTRHLFNQPKRAFSSGCIRLEKARDLADALLMLASKPESPDLDPLFDTDKTHKVSLAEPVPLYVTYWTAWVDENGVLNFRDDLYRHDRVELAQRKREQKQVNILQ